jgi:hypothetical protein
VADDVPDQALAGRVVEDLVVLTCGSVIAFISKQMCRWTVVDAGA